MSDSFIIFLKCLIVVGIFFIKNIKIVLILQSGRDTFLFCLTER